MNALRTRSFPPAASRLLAIAISIAAAGCARFATLEGVIKDERVASAPEVQLVRIERGGGTKKTQLGMALTKANRIVTGPDVSAVITFAAPPGAGTYSVQVFGDEGVERAADAFAIADLSFGDWSDRL